jgi:transcriptional regulator with XRE-family HTH domain
MATEPAIGTRIKRARDHKRWTQRQLAKALGVNVKTIDNWENDRTYPRSAIVRLEEVLDISFDSDEEPEDELTRLRREAEQLREETRQARATAQAWQKVAEALAEQRGKGNDGSEARAI